MKNVGNLGLVVSRRVLVGLRKVSVVDGWCLVGWGGVWRVLGFWWIIMGDYFMVGKVGAVSVMVVVMFVEWVFVSCCIVVFVDVIYVIVSDFVGYVRIDGFGMLDVVVDVWLFIAVGDMFDIHMDCMLFNDIFGFVKYLVCNMVICIELGCLVEWIIGVFD